MCKSTEILPCKKCFGKFPKYYGIIIATTVGTTDDVPILKQHQSDSDRQRLKTHSRIQQGSPLPDIIEWVISADCEKLVQSVIFMLFLTKVLQNFRFCYIM